MSNNYEKLAINLVQDLYHRPTHYELLINKYSVQKYNYLVRKLRSKLNLENDVVDLTRNFRKHFNIKQIEKLFLPKKKKPIKVEELVGEELHQISYRICKKCSDKTSLTSYYYCTYHEEYVKYQVINEFNEDYLYE